MKLAIFFLAISAFAQPFSWSYPTNPPLSAATFTVWRATGPCSSAGNFGIALAGIVAGPVSNNLSITSYTPDPNQPGAWAFEVSATVNGQSSARSGCVDRVILPPPPIIIPDDSLTVGIPRNFSTFAGIRCVAVYNGASFSPGASPWIQTCAKSPDESQQIAALEFSDRQCDWFKERCGDLVAQ